ncbi:MAG TPA: hypothetical protein VF120_17330 [Ktedonobacterales bacterium]
MRPQVHLAVNLSLNRRAAGNRGGRCANAPAAPQALPARVIQWGWAEAHSGYLGLLVITPE